MRSRRIPWSSRAGDGSTNAKLLALASAVLILCTAATRASALSASPDPSMSSTVTSTDGDAGGFSVAENVAWDPAFGPWVTELRNTGTGIASGDAVQLSESITNTGSLTWTEWHAAVVSTTVTSSAETIVGFLFVADSLVVMRDATPLVEGLDYTVTPIVHTATSGPPGGTNFGNWEAVSILFSPSGQIAPGQTLSVEMQIFEVFLDGDPWRPDDVAVIQQFPTVPEPATWGMLAGGLVFVLRRRRSSRRVRAQRLGDALALRRGLGDISATNGGWRAAVPPRTLTRGARTAGCHRRPVSARTTTTTTTTPSRPLGP